MCSHALSCLLSCPRLSSVTPKFAYPSPMSLIFRLLCCCVGDDAENWLKNINLDPQLFWTHHEQILNCQTDDEVTSLIKTLKHVEETRHTLDLDTAGAYSVSLDDTLFVLSKPLVGEKYPLKQG